MEITIKYVIYFAKRLLSSDNLVLEEVNFDNSQSNSFDSEQEAIEALIKDEKFHQDYLILKQVHIFKN